MLLLAAASMVASQNQTPDLVSFVGKIPQCGLSCITEQVPLSACGNLLNATCICTDGNLRKATENCVAERCTNVLEAIEVARVEAEACQRPVRSRKPALLAPLALEISAWFSVWLRLYSRYTIIHHFEADDWIMLACVIIYTPFLVLGQLIGMECFGVDIWTVDTDSLTQCLKIFQCSPIDYNWLGWKGTYGAHRCLNVNTLVYTAAGFSIAQDIMILVMPLPLALGLNMSWRNKIGVMIMFSLGIFILITSCIRLQYIVHFARSKNPTWDYTDTLIWTGLEVSVSLLVTSLPAVRGLLNRMIPNIFGTMASRYGFSFGTKKQDSGNSSALRSGKYSGAKYSNSATGPSNRIAVPEARFKLFKLSGRGQENESELELGDKLKGDVHTEIGASPSSWREGPVDEERHSSMESGIHVHTTTTVDSNPGHGRYGRATSRE
ncbi:hypothetical protein ACHAQH_001905 [Verticillium albo-atrum]